MFIIIEATKLDKEYSSTLKFDYNVINTKFKDLPSHVQSCLNLIIPENTDGDRYIIAPVVGHTVFSSDREFNVVAGFDDLGDAIKYCKDKNASVVRDYEYMVSMTLSDTETNNTHTVNGRIKFSSYEDVTEPYLLKIGRAILNLKESVTQTNKEDENDGEQSGKEEGVETPCRPAGCC